jgi:hypothetical protein
VDFNFGYPEMPMVPYFELLLQLCCEYSLIWLLNVKSLKRPENYNKMQVKLEGDIHQGIAHYKKALLYNWHYAYAMYNLGVAYGELLKFDMVSVT